MIELKTAGEIDAMRAAGRVVAAALSAMRSAAAPGVRLDELDEVARGVIDEAGARSSFLGYQPKWAPSPYPGVICASVNDAVVHGLPSPIPLQDGDLVSIDFAVHLDGWCADAAISFVVGDADPDDEALIRATQESLAAGIAACVPDAKLGDVSAAIAAVAHERGFALLADHGGHGIGRAMHEAPFVPNQGRAGRGLRLRPGVVLALEPMLLAGGTSGYRHDPDGWTVRSADGSRAAHVEHTVAVTADGPLVVTAA